MPKEDSVRSKPNVRTIISKAFEGDDAPGDLSVSIVSLVELCQLAMPDPVKIRERLREAQFEVGPEDRANEWGRMLSLDTNVIASPVRNLKHEMFGRLRHEAPVIVLLSVGDSKQGKVVFCSTVFRGAIEADAVKAAAHVIKERPFTGATTLNADGSILRRVFWDVNVSGVRGFMVTGPDDVEAAHLPRAFTAFNAVSAKRN